MEMTIQDLQRVQSLYPEHQIELQDGSIVLMSPSDFASEEVGTRFARLLGNWVEAHHAGRVVGSSAGFTLPGSNVRSPDVSFVAADRLKLSPRSYAALVPDLVVEVKSSSDRLKAVKEKVQRYLEMGAKVGILIDPDRRTVAVFRPGAEPVILKSGDTLQLDELFPGWRQRLDEIWPPVFG